jgi:hypothetical protein
MPGEEDGFCTRIDCVENPDNCPEGWSCFDLSVFGEDLSFCLPPS